MGNGPKSWNGAKRRLKRPPTAEASASMRQDVGKQVTGSRRKEREAAAKAALPLSVTQPMKKPARNLRDGEKRLRALNKLLRQIEELQEREAAGEELDEQQQDKLDRMGEVIEELEALTQQAA